MIFYSKLYQSLIPGKEIYLSLDKSKQQSTAKKLILGDSVANQLLSNKEFNGKLNSLCCNQAISLAGHYFILQNYLAHNPERLETIYFIYSPFSFNNNLDQEWSFNYFLKPFNTKEYQKFFTPTVKKQIQKIPYYYLAQITPILISHWAPPKVEEKLKLSYEFSPISLEYVKKIAQLAKEKNIKLVMIPPPTEKLREFEFFHFLKEVSKDPELKEIFLGFKDRMVFLPNNYFFDHLHLKASKVKEGKELLLKQIEEN